MGQFLEEIGLSQHAATFSEEEISGEVLLEATEEMLQELGVNSPVERLKIRVCLGGGEERGERREGERGGRRREEGEERGRGGGGGERRGRREEEERGRERRVRNLIDFLCISGVVPAETAGWCGAVSPADSAELLGAVQAEQVLSHLPEVGHGWGSPPGG